MCDYCIDVVAEDVALAASGGEHLKWLEKELALLGVTNIMDYKFKDMVDPAEKARRDKEMDEWLAKPLP